MCSPFVVHLKLAKASLVDICSLLYLQQVNMLINVYKFSIGQHGLRTLSVGVVCACTFPSHLPSSSQI